MATRQRRGRGFTLVEMLVVIGIICLLAGLLLPVLSGARRASVNTKCINNLREIGMAVSQYMSDNEQALPYGVSTMGCYDDPSRVIPVMYDLDSYLKYNLNVWKCPGTRVVRQEPPQTMRAPHVLVSAELEPREGREEKWRLGVGSWRPGYMYVGTHGWKWFQTNDRPAWDKYGMEYWKVRNVAGLRLDQIKTTKVQPASEVVVFFDYSTKFHSKSGDDVYSLEQPDGYLTKGSAIRRGQFQSNFLFLDGHVDTKRFTWQGGLLNVVHHPIRQRWDENLEGDYVVTYADAYKAEFED